MLRRLRVSIRLMSSSAPLPPPTPMPKGNIFARMAAIKAYLKRYGLLSVALYTPLYCGTLAVMWGGVATASYLSGVSTSELMQSAPMPETLREAVSTENSANLAAAIVLTECTELPRLGILLAITPKVAVTLDPKWRKRLRIDP
jgi:hypothetical protein